MGGGRQPDTRLAKQEAGGALNAGDGVHSPQYIHTEPRPALSGMRSCCPQVPQGSPHTASTLKFRHSSVTKSGSG
jgi:hypothetical protein